MVNGKAKLVLDIGNSSTKMTVKFGTNSKGQPRARTEEIPNRFGEIEPEKLASYLANPVYTDENSRVFKYHGSNYCNGSLCDIEYGALADRPTALIKKYDSLVTRLTLQNALCRAYETIADFMNCDIDSLELTWDMVLLLPPDDIEVGSTKIINMAREINHIDFLMPEFSKDIVIDHVNVYPEGFAAFIAILYESYGVVRPDYAYLVSRGSTTLIADIGAGTTDFMLVSGANVVASTRFTRDVGGNNVHQRVRRILKQEGIPLTDAAAREGCVGGYVMDGAKKVPIISQIAQAKSYVSKQLVDAVQEFFEDNMIPIQSITNLVICGGGAEKSDKQGIEPISNYVYNFMKRISPNINLVELPYEGEGENKVQVRPRYLNIMGASVLADSIK